MKTLNFKMKQLGLLNAIMIHLSIQKHYVGSFLVVVEPHLF